MANLPKFQEFSVDAKQAIDAALMSIGREGRSDEASLRLAYAEIDRARRLAEIAQKALIEEVPEKPIEPSAPDIEQEEPEDTWVEIREPVHIHQPKREDLDWIVEGNNVGGVSSKYAGKIYQTPHGIAKAYAESEAGSMPVIGVIGEHPSYISFGHGYSIWDPNLCSRPGENTRVKIIGLTDDASVSFMLGNNLNFVEDLELWNIGIQGRNDSFIIRQEGDIGGLVMDGCWFKRHKPGHQHMSGAHFGFDWRFMLIRNWNGERQRQIGALQAQHDWYWKGGGPLFFLDNECVGGNRTIGQYRPHTQPWATPKPHGPIVFRRNKSNGYGWDHGSAPETYAGGAAFTIWTSVDQVVEFSENKITNAKYSCCAISQPITEQVPYLTDDGFSHSRVQFKDNVFENTNGDRHTMYLSAAREIDFHGNNQITGSKMAGALSINSTWAKARSNAKKIGRINFWGEDAAPLGEKNFFYEHEITEEQLRRMIV